MKSYAQFAIGLALASQAAVIQAEIKSVNGTASMYFPPNIPVVSASP